MMKNENTCKVISDESCWYSRCTDMPIFLLVSFSCVASLILNYLNRFAVSLVIDMGNVIWSCTICPALLKCGILVKNGFGYCEPGESSNIPYEGKLFIICLYNIFEWRFIPCFDWNLWCQSRNFIWLFIFCCPLCT